MTGSEAAPAGIAAPGAVTLDSRLKHVLPGTPAGALAKAFGMVTVGDLLSHYPRRYARRGELTKLSELPVDENVTIVAEVLEVTKRSMKSTTGTIVEAKISDGKGILTLTFFNQPWRDESLRPGMRGMFAGKVSNYKGHLQLTHPNYELFDAPADAPAADETAARKWIEAPIPVYPATAKVASWQLRKLIEDLLARLGPVPDPLPDELRAQRRLLPHVAQAYRLIHAPQAQADWQRARDRFRYQEALVLQSALARRRAQLAAEEATARPPCRAATLASFDRQLPFTLTAGQSAVGKTLAGELAQDSPMNRLVQGEVGSGKTLVALRAMLAVADAGGQAALLAPTEVLAAQHLRDARPLRSGPDARRPTPSRRCSPALCPPRRGSRPCSTPPPERPGS